MLNYFDGGARMTFDSAAAWMTRLDTLKQEDSMADDVIDETEPAKDAEATAAKDEAAKEAGEKPPAPAVDGD